VLPTSVIRSSTTPLTEMVPSVLRLVGEQPQVLDNVVLSVSVNVVDYLFGGKESTQMLFHYKTVLSYIPLRVSVWVAVT